MKQTAARTERRTRANWSGGGAPLSLIKRERGPKGSARRDWLEGLANQVASAKKLAKCLVGNPTAPNTQVTGATNLSGELGDEIEVSPVHFFATLF